jgi:ribosomal protein S18 acetylase RimI-like enzyme
MSIGTSGTIETPGALRNPPVASGKPHRLLSYTTFQSSSGECRLKRSNQDGLPDRDQTVRADMSDERFERLKAASNPRRAKPEDAGALSRLFAAAFLNDPVFDWSARPGSKRAAGLEWFFYWFLHMRAIPLGEVWMSEDGATCAAWLPPDTRARPRGFFEQLKLMPLFVRLRGFVRFRRGSAIANAMEKSHPHERHFYLAFMAVEPRFQGMGLGSAILEATLKRADAAHVPAYLENSNPKNTRLYERAGFVTQKNISPDGAPPLAAMWRPTRFGGRVANRD